MREVTPFLKSDHIYFFFKPTNLFAQLFVVNNFILLKADLVFWDSDYLPFPHACLLRAFKPTLFAQLFVVNNFIYKPSTIPNSSLPMFIPWHCEWASSLLLCCS